MKNLIIIFSICLGSIVSYGQISTVQKDGNFILHGDFIDVENVKCWFYKGDGNGEWELSHTTKYFKKYYISIDTCCSLLIYFDNGKIYKGLYIYPNVPDQIKLNMDFSLNIGIDKVLFYNDIENIYQLTDVIWEDE